jgi:hypothetical protein
MSRLSYFLGLMAFLQVSYVSKVKGQNDDILCLPCVRDWIKTYGTDSDVFYGELCDKIILNAAGVDEFGISYAVVSLLDNKCNQWDRNCNSNQIQIFEGKLSNLPNCDSSPTNEDILCLPCVREYIKSYDNCGGINLKVVTTQV